MGTIIDSGTNLPTTSQGGNDFAAFREFLTPSLTYSVLGIYHSDMSRTAVTTDPFTAIAEPRRRQIIELLARQKSLAVGAIVVALGLPQPVVSKHLGVLREVGIVAVSKQSRHRVYELNFERLRTVYDWIKAFEQHWDHQLDRIRAKAERRAAQLANVELAESKDNSSDKKGTS